MATQKAKLDNYITVWDILDKAIYKFRRENDNLKGYKILGEIIKILKENNEKFKDLWIYEIADFKIWTATSLKRNLCIPLENSWVYKEWFEKVWVSEDNFRDILLKIRWEIYLELNPEKINTLISVLKINNIEKWWPKILIDLKWENWENIWKNLYDVFRNNIRRLYFSAETWKNEETLNWKYIIKKVSDFSKEGKKFAKNFEMQEEYFMISSAIEKLFLVLKKDKVEKWNLKYLHENRRWLYEFFNWYMNIFWEKDFSFVLREMKNFWNKWEDLVKRYIWDKKWDI